VLADLGFKETHALTFDNFANILSVACDYNVAELKNMCKKLAQIIFFASLWVVFLFITCVYYVSTFFLNSNAHAAFLYSRIYQMVSWFLMIVSIILMAKHMRSLWNEGK
jgi:hypothetical protein